jgi:S-disulfanyl-L-cysteine oxidoreductase SoxD
MSMRASRWTIISCGALFAACMTAAPNVRTPLGAYLTPDAKTGPQTPLRFDPTAKVILSNASNLPAASFSPAQASRGEKIYEETCGTCHQPGQLVGQTFVESWNDRRVWDFYSLVRATMPLDKPGGMKDQEYVDVVAYLLQANHGAPGSDSLAADTAAMRGRKIAVKFP